jgi:cyclase
MKASIRMIPRVIPCLLLSDEAMVKTVRFGSPTYLGDPVNVVNLFNRFEVDEIVLLDIGATPNGTDPAFGLITELAAECWVPLTYGGGIRNLEAARRVLASGVEKVVLGTAAANDPDLVSVTSSEFGAQAVVVAVDTVARSAGSYEVVVEHGRRGTGIDPVAYAQRAEALGAGEIFLNSVDRDGTMAGYDLDLIRQVSASVTVPVIACGGAGDRLELTDPVLRAGASAVAAGSLFVFKSRERGVLINFPERDQLEALFASNGWA